MSVCVCVCESVCMCALSAGSSLSVRVYVCANAFVRACEYTLRVCTYAGMRLCVRVCLSVRVYVCAYVRGRAFWGCLCLLSC